jgi:iron complex outermembrane receptor protein
MKTIYISLLILLTILGANAIEPTKNPTKASLEGKITDRSTGETLPGVSIYFPDLKTGTTSKNDGTFFIAQLPAVKVLVQVSSMGYKLKAATIDLGRIQKIDFALEPAITEISEVVVTGQTGSIEKEKTPSPITTISASYLKENSSSNIVDALSSVAGISQITTGGAISKPVIRGLGYNRVVVINDGIRQEGQQWGDEHGIEIDGFSVNKAEVLKGPASLAFGSDAMAGVINLMSAPVLPEGTITGNISGNYQTNNGLIGNSVNFSGNQNGFIWDFRASEKLAHDYQNRYDGRVFNSRFAENAYEGTLGINRSWGYSHLILSAYQLKPGIVEGERDSLTGKFLRTLPTGESVIASTSDLKKYQPENPYQLVNHYKVVSENNFYLGKGNLKATIGFQQNNRKEFALPETPDQYQLFFQLNSVNYDFQYSFAEKKNLNLTLGWNGMWQQSENKGSEFLVPAYRLFDAGVFVIFRKKYGKLDLLGGIRGDLRHQNGEPLYLDEEGNVISAGTSGATERFAAFDRTFNGFSASLGGSYQISEEMYAKLNVSKGFRAPNIAELGSNGVHEGTLRYEKGNTNLNPEESFQVDFTTGLNTSHVASELNLFTNSVNNFIFSHKLNDAAGDPVLIYNVPVFLYTSGKAFLYGGEFTLDIHPHPHDWIHFENSLSYVHTELKNQPAGSRYLPFTPPFHWRSDIKTELDNKSKHFKNAYVRFGIDWYAAQNNVFSAYDTETATPGYTLLNMGVGTDFVSGGKTRFSLIVVGQNLADIGYQNHLSRLKYSATNYATDRMGVFNMGRNFSLKLLIPISFSEAK